MLLVQGYLRDLNEAEEPNFQGYYLTLTYEKNNLTEAQHEDDKNTEIGIPLQAHDRNTESKFLLSGTEMSDLLKQEPLGINIIKNIKDIAGYKDELSSEKARPELTKLITANTTALNASQVLTRIEVADSGEFIIQISEDEIYGDIELKAYSADGSLLDSFTYPFQQLASFSRAKQPLEMKIKAKTLSYTRRSFLETVPVHYSCEGEFQAATGLEIPEGVSFTIWVSNKEVNRFNPKDFQILAVSKTKSAGLFSLKLSSKLKYKTAFLTLNADKTLIKKIDLDANSLIPSSLKIIFKNPKFETVLKQLPKRFIAEEFIFYKALRTTQFGIEDQLNSSSFIKAISCFDNTLNLEMKKVAHGHLISIKQEWLIDAEINIASSAVLNLVKACFDEPFSDYYIGGDALTSNVDLRPPNSFDKTLNKVLHYSFQSLEEKIKRKLSELRLQSSSKTALKEHSVLNYHVKQSLYDARECLFIPFALEEFNADRILAFKDILLEHLIGKEYQSLLEQFKFYNDEDYDFETDNLIRHLNDNLEYYHRLIWYKMPANKRFSLLDNCVAPNTNGKSIASVVENRVIGILGNSVIMPLAPGYNLDPNLRQYSSLLDLYKDTEKFSEFVIVLPH